MDFNDFANLIRKNSEKGKRTEFFKLQLSIDDYRKSKPTDFGLEDVFFADYDKSNKNYIIYYPETEEGKDVSDNEIEEEFYDNNWGSYIHK